MNLVTFSDSVNTGRGQKKQTKNQQHSNSSLEVLWSDDDMLSSTIVNEPQLHNGNDGDSQKSRRRRHNEGEPSVTSIETSKISIHESENEVPPVKKKKRQPRKRNLRPEDQRTLQILKEKFRFDEGKYKCNVEHCHKKLDCGKPSNLKRHLSRHKKLYTQLFPNEVNARKRAELEAFNITQDAVELVTVNGYPFAMLNASGMKGFVKSRLESIQSEGFRVAINRRDVVKDVEAESNLIKKYIKDALKGKTISLMFDVCTITTLSMLGVNVTIMNEADVVCWSLGTIQINERHTAVNLADQLYDILREYDIPLTNVLSVTTDTAKNAVATSKVLNLVANSIEKSDDIADDSIFDIDPEDDEVNFGMDIENEAELQKIIDNVEKHSKLVKEMAEIVRSKVNSIILINQVDCGAHVYQLSVNDSLIESNSINVINEVHEMCKLMRTQIVMIELRKLGCDVILPPMDNATRWNSKFLMVNS